VPEIGDVVAGVAEIIDRRMCVGSIDDDAGGVTDQFPKRADREGFGSANKPVYFR
jgi:hypothetical protein